VLKLDFTFVTNMCLSAVPLGACAAVYRPKARSSIMALF